MSQFLHPSTLTDLRRRILTAAAHAGEGHIPSALSVLDLIWVLYNRVLRLDPSRSDDPDRDRFVLSKGHASLALYAVLADRGFFPISELDGFGAYDSRLGGHPDCNKVPGVEVSAGSLGHGFPMAVGMALGARVTGKTFRTICLIGDGEANEGSVWEAALLAAHHQLSALTCIVDYNHSTDRALRLGDLGEKFAAFGWRTLAVDGHDHQAIENALATPAVDQPLCIIANTIKGFGCPPLENQPAWHHRAPSAAELQTLLEAVR